MLYRTNRTLSASSNRLNLGTRLFAAPAITGNMDTQTLRIRPDHPQVFGVSVRAGGSGYPGGSKTTGTGKTWPSGSFPQATQLLASCAQATRSALLAEAPPVWRDVVDTPPRWSERPRDRQPSVTESRANRSTRLDKILPRVKSKG